MWGANLQDLRGGGVAALTGVLRQHNAGLMPGQEFAVHREGRATLCFAALHLRLHLLHAHSGGVDGGVRHLRPFPGCRRVGTQICHAYHPAPEDTIIPQPASWQVWPP
jgi:hypothetical protein